jgi:hypothetical protein
MKRFELSILLQKLAERLDCGEGTVLEQQSFDALMEILNEDIKTRHTVPDGNATYLWPRQRP